VPIANGLEDAAATLQAAVDAVVHALAQHKTVRPQRAVKAAIWRLVVAGGFYALAARPLGRWSVELTAAAASELEPVCPAPFDELATAAIPVSETKAWVCGYPTAVMDAWMSAATKMGLGVAGFWSPAGALIDSLVERAPMAAAAAGGYWQDGRVRLELTTASRANQPSRGPNVSWRQSWALENIRVFACRDAPAVSEELVTDLLPRNSAFTGIPRPFLPAAAAHGLLQIDPSESMNLLRKTGAGATARSSSSHRLAAALGWCAAALAIYTGSNVLVGSQANRQAAQAQSLLTQAWHQSQGQTPLPALPVAMLESQARAWQGVSSAEGSLRSSQPVVALWASLAQALPADLSVHISSLRYRQTDLWIDGRVPSQAEVRRLEAAWSKLPGLTADPFRVTGGGAGSTVNFSVRMAVQ
jgi:hypothetical protein